MKFYISLVIFTCLQISLSAQVEFKKFYHPNGKVSAEGVMKNGKPVGIWKSYYPDGVLKSVGKRHNDKPDSIWNFYDRQGILKSSISYRRGVRNGYSEEYKLADDTGKVYFLASKELYLNGKKHGESEYYDKNKKLKRTLEFENGYKHGKEIFYNDKGLIISIITYHYDNITDSENINRVDRQGLKQGVWKLFFPNRKVKISASYLDGKLHGYKREYNIKGKLLSTDYYLQGQLQEKEKEDKQVVATKTKLKKDYYADGKLKSKGNFLGNKRVGTHIFYDKLGKIEYYEDFDTTGVKTGKGAYSQDGKRVGQWQHFYANGKLKSKGNYQNGKRHGKWTFYFLNEKTEQTGSYSKGKPQGKWKWLYENGATRRIGQFRKGKETGLFVEFTQTGDTLSRGSYSEGFKQGEHKRKVNDMLYLENYSYGKLDGLIKHYYSNNKLAFKGSYISGLPDGVHTYYYPNGKLKLKAYYFSGKRAKKWYRYSDTGLLLTIAEYKNDTKIRIDGMKLKTEF